MSATIEDFDADNADYDLPALASSSQAEPAAAPRPAPPPPLGFSAEQLRPWVALYPVYFDRDASRAAGRRVPRRLAAPACDLVLLVQATQLAVQETAAPLLVAVEPRKRHPKDPLRAGRVRVQLRVDGGPANARLPGKEALLRAVGGKLEAAKEPAAAIRRQNEEVMRMQFEVQKRQTAQQLKAQAQGGQMSLPAMISSGAGLYQPSDAVKKAQTMVDKRGAKLEDAKAKGASKDAKGKGKAGK
ncbi:hypothetical protein DFJ74DRAFT_703144 [Hyaloraphidium curvatum]|nr:hypothetical protein DFJ74DRAFT_703144 [Hyaloraphidium curvatum]